MKRLIFFMLFVSWGAFAGVPGWMNDYDDALEAAQKSGKPILMMYSAKT